MAIYKIMRIYEVPADSKQQAMDRMMQALSLGVERDYHVTDFIKSPDDAKGKGKRISLTPPKGWGRSILEQLFSVK